jgi:hypothetical protein
MCTGKGWEKDVLNWIVVLCNIHFGLRNAEWFVFAYKFNV